MYKSGEPEVMTRIMHCIDIFGVHRDAINLLRKYDLLGSPLREDGIHSGGVVAPLNPPFPAKG